MDLGVQDSSSSPSAFAAAGGIGGVARSGLSPYFAFMSPYSLLPFDPLNPSLFSFFHCIPFPRISHFFTGVTLPGLCRYVASHSSGLHRPEEKKQGGPRSPGGTSFSFTSLCPAGQGLQDQSSSSIET